MEVTKTKMSREIQPDIDEIKRWIKDTPGAAAYLGAAVVTLLAGMQMNENERKGCRLATLQHLRKLGLNLKGALTKEAIDEWEDM